MFVATGDSNPLVKMERLIPRSQVTERVIYVGLEFKQWKFISFIWKSGSQGKFWDQYGEKQKKDGTEE